MSNHEHLPKKPKINHSEEVFHKSLIHVTCDILQVGEETPYPYYVLKTNPYAVIILATTVDEKYLLIKEYRHPTLNFILSCPAGYIDKQEDPLAAAKRELLEETGYSAKSFKIIGSAYPYAGISGQKNIYVKAEQVTKVQPPQLEKSEIIYPCLLTKSELVQAIQKESELDANLLAALSFQEFEIRLQANIN